MLQRARNWHSGLSKFGKAVVWSVTAVLAGTAINAAASPQSTPIPPPTQTISQTTKKEPVITKKTITETADVVFDKTTVNDGNLEKGKSEIRTAGVNGVKTFTYDVMYEDGVQTEKKLIKEEITTVPVTEVTAIGTYVAPQPNCDPNYSPCIPYYSGNALNCADIGVEVRVIGDDHNRFDADGDGWGCESYR